MGEGEGGMIWDSTAETRTSPVHVEEITSGSLTRDAGNATPVLYENLGGWTGRGGSGRGVQDGGVTCMPTGFMLMNGRGYHSTVVILQLK